MPALPGLYRRVLLADGHVNHDAWRAAVANGESVGVCECGGQLIPNRPRSVSMNRTDYDADCDNCERSVLAPYGKTNTGKKKNRMSDGYTED